MSDARQVRFVDGRGRDVERSNGSGLGDPHGLFLPGPEEREIDPFGQGLGGELGRLVTSGDRLDNLWRQERETHQSSDIAA